jgi:selenocysteine lyase/cysteine desulfurase
MNPKGVRDLFPVLERFAYLNAGTFGPLSHATIAAMDDRLRADEAGGRAGKAWFEAVFALRTSVRAKLAALIGAPTESLALTSSTTDGCNVVLAGLDLRPEDEVVTTDAEHPGLLLPLHASGARVAVAEVATRSADDALAALVGAITRRTRLLAVSHVLWTTGQIVPVHELKRVTGLPVLVDGAQSVGAIPVDVGDLDFYTVSCQKWLCGPEPTGALYVRDPESLRVAIPTGFAHRSLERDGRFVAKDGAPRFDTGWTAGAALAGLDAALDLAPDWRFDRGAELARLCRAELGRTCELIGDDTPSLVSFVSPHGDAPAAASRLYEEGVVVRDLPTGWLRASCGWWNDEDDIARLVDGVAGLA